MPDNGPKPEEPLCAYWQKKCSEVNPGKVVCRKFMTVMGKLPGELVPHPIMMCQDDFSLNTLQKMLQDMMAHSDPGSFRFPGGLIKPH